MAPISSSPLTSTRSTMGNPGFLPPADVDGSTGKQRRSTWGEDQVNAVNPVNAGNSVNAVNKEPQSLPAVPCELPRASWDPVTGQSPSSLVTALLQGQSQSQPQPQASVTQQPTALPGRFCVTDVVLGSGQYGTVKECTDLVTGETLACKTINKEFLNSSAQGSNLRREIEFLTRVGGHEGVVGLKGVFQAAGETHLVMDLCRGGELFDEVIRRGSFHEPDAAHLFAELASAVAFCHARGVMHRDLKPENILLTRKLPEGVPLSRLAAEGPLIKLADFGLAVETQPGETFKGAAGSPFYVAPEVLKGEYDTKADVWSLGVILYILLSGSPPFWGETDADVFDAIKNEEPDFAGAPWDRISRSARRVVMACLDRNPDRRPTAEKLLSYPWLVQHVGKSTRTPGFNKAAAPHSFKAVALAVA